jgi:transcriptional regulator with XRE-family HTH domain
MALDGQPQVDKGKLKFDSKTQVKLGNLNLSLSQMADRLGIPVDRLERQLVLQLERGNLQIEDLELIDDRAAITGILDGDRP